MDMVYNIGLMEHITKVIGIIIKQKDKELSGMQKAMFIGVNLKMIWQMVTENILTLTVQNIKVNLETTFRKVMVKKNGLMVLNM
jgi:hypothetical protein